MGYCKEDPCSWISWMLRVFLYILYFLIRTMQHWNSYSNLSYVLYSLCIWKFGMICLLWRHKTFCSEQDGMWEAYVHSYWTVFQKNNIKHSKFHTDSIREGKKVTELRSWNREIRIKFPNTTQIGPLMPQMIINICVTQSRHGSLKSLDLSTSGSRQVLLHFNYILNSYSNISITL